MAKEPGEPTEAEIIEHGNRMLPIEVFRSALQRCKEMLTGKEIPKGGYQHLETYRQAVDTFLQKFQAKIDLLSMGGATQAPEKELDALTLEAQEILNSI